MQDSADTDTRGLTKGRCNQARAARGRQSHLEEAAGHATWAIVRRWDKGSTFLLNALVEAEPPRQPVARLTLCPTSAPRAPWPGAPGCPRTAACPADGPSRSPGA